MEVSEGSQGTARSESLELWSERDFGARRALGKCRELGLGRDKTIAKPFFYETLVNDISWPEEKYFDDAMSKIAIFLQFCVFTLYFLCISLVFLTWTADSQ